MPLNYLKDRKFENLMLILQTTTGIDGKTWALCEEKPEFLMMSTSDKLNPPAIVTQHSDLPRRFVLLSAQVSMYNVITF